MNSAPSLAAFHQPTAGKKEGTMSTADHQSSRNCGDKTDNISIQVAMSPLKEMDSLGVA